MLILGYLGNTSAIVLCTAQDRIDREQQASPLVAAHAMLHISATFYRSCLDTLRNKGTNDVNASVILSFLLGHTKE